MKLWLVIEPPRNILNVYSLSLSSEVLSWLIHQNVLNDYSVFGEDMLLTFGTDNVLQSMCFAYNVCYWQLRWSVQWYMFMSWEVKCSVLNTL